MAGRIGPGFARLAALEVGRAAACYEQGRRSRRHAVDRRAAACFGRCSASTATMLAAVRRAGPAIFTSRVQSCPQPPPGGRPAHAARGDPASLVAPRLTSSRGTPPGPYTRSEPPYDTIRRHRRDAIRAPRQGRRRRRRARRAGRRRGPRRRRFRGHGARGAPPRRRPGGVVRGSGRRGAWSTPASTWRWAAAPTSSTSAGGPGSTTPCGATARYGSSAPTATAPPARRRVSCRRRCTSLPCSSACGTSRSVRRLRARAAACCGWPEASAGRRGAEHGPRLAPGGRANPTA